MKRSEVLDILQIFFESDCAFEDAHDARISACRVLDIVEDCGMLPPSTEFTMGGKKVKDNYWEPENGGH